MRRDAGAGHGRRAAGVPHVWRGRRRRRPRRRRPGQGGGGGGVGVARRPRPVRVLRDDAGGGAGGRLRGGRVCVRRAGLGDPAGAWTVPAARRPRLSVLLFFFVLALFSVAFFYCLFFVVVAPRPPMAICVYPRLHPATHRAGSGANRTVATRSRSAAGGSVASPVHGWPPPPRRPRRRGPASVRCRSSLQAHQERTGGSWTVYYDQAWMGVCYTSPSRRHLHRCAARTVTSHRQPSPPRTAQTMYQGWHRLSVETIASARPLPSGKARRVHHT